MSAPFRVPQKSMQNQVCWTCGWQGDKLPPPAVNFTEITESEFNKAPEFKKFMYGQ